MKAKIISSTRISISLAIIIVILGLASGIIGAFLYQTFASQESIISEKLVSIPLTEISSYALLQKMNNNDKDFIIVDVRDKASYDLGHVKGAISMTLEEVPSRYKELPTDKDIIIYCWSQECMLGPTVSSALAKLGFTNIKELRIGWCEWAERGYPIEGKRYILKSECLEPQISTNNQTVEIIDSISQGTCSSTSGQTC